MKSVMFNSCAELQDVAKGKIFHLIITCEPCNLGRMSSSEMCSYVAGRKLPTFQRKAYYMALHPKGR